ncbi:MAG: glycoside hydrolase family 130 protein [Candidatus ainarchaeum sp.]|nr:glycoside hydrolase family 130 protein [Candidatus ainarchaeum sp.]
MDPTSILKRYENNPILKPEDMPTPCCAVYNSGVIKTPEGEYIMASRFEKPNKVQYVWVSRSKDGINFTPDPEPLKFVYTEEQREEYEETVFIDGPLIGSWYDPRINPVEGEYYITYCVGGDYSCRIALGKTKDFRTVEHVSFPLHILNRNAVLFPEKINGEYWMLHRPQNTASSSNGNIWISSSPDLKYWGNCRVVAKPENYWENKKIGPAAPPIRTDKGWLVIYHGVFPHSNGVNYAGGVMLLDLEKPWKVIGRCKDPILYVKELYEMVGQVPNVVFPGAAIPESDGTVKVYYGGADYVQCLATGKLDDLINACLTRKKDNS